MGVRILLGRHGESDGNVDAINYLDGDSTRQLTIPKGWEQVLGSGNFLSDYYTEQGVSEWPTIFVSPYERTLQTFRGIYEGLKNTFKGEPKLKEEVRLIEKFFGAASHLAFADENYDPAFIAALERLSKDTYANDPTSTAHLFGESTLATMVRVKGFIDGTLSRDLDEGQKEFLIVTHGAVIQAFIMAWMHLPMRAKAELGNPNNGDIIAIEGEPKNWRVTKLYDGEKGERVNIDLTQHIKRLSVDRLPPVPKLQ